MAKDNTIKWYHSIEKRLIMIFILAMLLTFSVMTAISIIVGVKEHERHEIKQVENSLSIGLNLLKSQVDDVALLAKDYGEWDETYRFIESPSLEFIQGSMDLDSLNSANIDVVLIQDLEGNVLHKLSSYDYSTEQALWNELNLNPLETSDQVERGAIFLHGRILVYVSNPTSDNSGKATTNGRITLMRELNQRTLEWISELVGESFNIVNMTQPDAVEHVRFGKGWKVEKSEITFFEDKAKGVFSLFISDEVSLPLLIEIEMDRQEHQWSSVWRWLIPEIIMLFILTFSLLFILRATVTNPIVRLIEWLNQVNGSQFAEDLKPFKHNQYNEIGVLSNKFSEIYNNLYQQHQFSQLLLYSISDFIFTVDSRGRVDYCNPAAAEWLKIDSRQVYEQDFELLLACVDENAPSVSNWLYRALETYSEYSGQVLVRKLSDPSKTYLVEVQVSPILNNDSEHKGAMIILRPKEEHLS